MSFLTVGDELITIASTDNVGIGTINPTSKLTVSGDSTITDITYTSTLINRTSTSVVSFDPENSNTRKFMNWLNTFTSEATRNWWATTSPLFSKIDTILSGSTNYYSDSVLLPDRRVIFVPYNAPNIGIFNSRTNTFVLGPTVLPSGNEKYVGGVLLPNGSVIFVPYNATNIGIYNPNANTFEVLSGNLTGLRKYYGGVLLPNGKVVFVPNNSESIGIYNPTQNTYTTSQTGLLIGNNKFRGGVICPDGKVVFIPKNSLFIAIYDCITDTYDNTTKIGRNDADFKQVSTGTGYTMFLSNEGRVYTRGFNTNGQIGTGISYTNSLTFQYNTIDNYFTNNGITIADIACGETHTIFLTTTGVLYGVGRNSEGQLGIGNFTNMFVPVVITTLSDISIAKVYCGQHQTMFLTTDGRVYATGWNANGQLGINTITNINIPILITYFTITDVQIIDKIACGLSHTLFLTREKTVYACGLRTNGRLGTISTAAANIVLPAKIIFSNSNNIIDIATGNTHSLFITDTNTVLACGSFANGRLGTGSSVDIGIPISIDSFITNNILITKVSVGDFHSLFLTSTGSVYVCGGQVNGRLGNGLTASANITIPALLENFSNIKQVCAGREFSCFLKTDGSLYTCGVGSSGQLGNGPYTLDVGVPTLVNTITNIDRIIDGSARYNTFVIQSGTSSVYGFGYNNYGQLSIGGNVNQFSPIQPVFPASFTNNIISKVSSGVNHTLLLEETTGKVYATGLNTNGQLGLSDTNYRTAPYLITKLNDKIITDVSCGTSHSLFVNQSSPTSSDMYACGLNANGQLGNGNFIDQSSPIRSQKCATFIKNNTYLNIVQVEAGNEHSLILTATGEVYGIGRNSEGQLGMGDFVNKTTVSVIPSLIGIDIEKIYCGQYHSMFIERNTGRVYVTGYNNWGQLGISSITNMCVATLLTYFSETNPHIIRSISCTSSHTLFLTSLGTVFACGAQHNGRLGNNSAATAGIFIPFQTASTVLTNVKQVSCGEAFSLFLTNDGLVYGTGYNIYGQLGTGNTTQLLIPTLLTFFTTASPPIIITQVSAGWDHSLFLTSLGNVYACGLQTSGRLGNNLTTAENVLTPIII